MYCASSVVYNSQGRCKAHAEWVYGILQVVDKASVGLNGTPRVREVYELLEGVNMTYLEVYKAPQGGAWLKSSIWLVKGDV